MIVLKPWGTEELILRTKDTIVTKITIKPKHRTSLHLHKNEQEYLIILEGKPKIEKYNYVYYPSVNTCFFIKENVKHRIVNDSNKEIVLLKTSNNNIFPDNSSIIRIHDDYGRKI